MRKILLAAAAAAALSGSAFALSAAAAPADSSESQHMGMMGEDRAFMLDARIAGMKAALKLTPDQDKLWPAFETAVREATKMRQDAMREMNGGKDEEDKLTPIDRMNRMSAHMAAASAELKKVADAAKPLYDSLDETQKHHFGPLMMSLRPHGGHMGMNGGHMGMNGGWRHQGDEAQ